MRSGRNIVSLIVILMVSVLIFAAASRAEIPLKINYQGMLTDTGTGEPLTGFQPMTFKLYDASSAGSLLWSESQSVSANSEGIFTAILGSITPIDVSFEGQVWLEVEVDGDILSPRREIVSVPFAFHTGWADSADWAEEAALAQNSDSLGGHIAGDFIMEGETAVITSEMIVGGAGSGLNADLLDSLNADAFADTSHDHDDRYVTRDSLTAVGTLNEGTNPVDWTRLKNVPAGFADGSDDAGGGAGDGHSLDADDGDPVDALYVDLAGRVGIGTTSPATPLHISGDRNSQVVLTIENTSTDQFSGERLSFNDENGSVAFIVTHDPDNPEYPNGMILGNNRSGGSIYFHTAGLPRMILDNDGQLGIGTTSPTNPLHVTSAGHTWAKVAAGGTDGIAGLTLSNDTRSWEVDVRGDFDDAFMIRDNNASTSRLTIGTDGNVGLGTDDPDYALSIRRDVNDLAALEIENTNTGVSSGEAIIFRHEGGTTAQIRRYDEGHSSYPDQLLIRNNGSDPGIQLQVETTVGLAVDSQGYVGVGHPDPGNLLHVEGEGTDEGGVSGYGEVSARLKTTGGSHTALSVDAILDRDAIVYFAEDSEAVWGLRNDDSDGSKFQLRYHGGAALGRKYLTVDSTGNIGAGTIYPDQKLHIYESLPGETSYGLKLDNPGGTALTSAGILFKVDGGGAGRGKGAIVYERTDTWNRGDFHILQNSDTNDDEVALGNAVMTIRNNGYVGIGSTTPSSKFEVQSSTTGGRLCFFKQSNASNAADVIRAETAGSGNALSGSSQDGRGVVGHSANDYAGYFNGNVYVSGSINKAACMFVIDHPLDPENKILRHNCVESPEHLLIYRGRVHLNGDGEGMVEMVDYFDALARAEEASIHLTSVGRPFLTGAEWNAEFDGFTVYGDPGREVFWEVLAERDDPVVRQVGLPVEEDKGPDNKLCDRGRLLNPEAYGYPEAMGQDYELMQGLTGE